MKQQINLHQPMYRKQRTLFSAGVVLRIGLIIIAGLGLIFGFAVSRTQLQAAERTNLGQQRDTLQRRIEQFSTEFVDRPESQLLRAEMERLNAEKEQKLAVMQVLSRGGLGNTKGFSPHFEALARQRLSGLWLTQIALFEGGEQIRLVGRTLDEGLLPRYLRKLAHEEVFAGTEFESARLLRSSAALEPVAFELHTQTPRSGTQP